MNSKLLIGGLALFLLLPNLGCEKSAEKALPTSQREAKRGHLSSLENFSESELSAFTATYDPADPKSKEKAISTLDKTGQSCEAIRLPEDQYEAERVGPMRHRFGRYHWARMGQLPLYQSST